MARGGPPAAARQALLALLALLGLAGAALGVCPGVTCPSPKCKNACNAVASCGWVGPKKSGDAGCVPVEQLCSRYRKKGCSKKSRKSKCSWNGSSCVANLGPTPGPTPGPPTPSSDDMACGALATKDPRVFGPNMWRALHIFAQWTPPAPRRDDMVKLCSEFVAALPMMLPDPVSGANFLDFIKGHRLSKEVCLTKDNFVTVMVEAQNYFSSYTSPGRKAWTPKDAEATYKYDKRGNTACRHSGTWNGSGALCHGWPGEIEWAPGVLEKYKDAGVTINNNICQTYAQGEANTPPGGVSPYTPIPAGSGATGSGTSPATTCWGGLKDVEACAFNEWAGINMYPWQGLGKAVQAVLGPNAADDTQLAYWCSTPDKPIPTDEATSFGPIVWPAIHQMALWYPEDPRDDTKAQCEKFIKALPALIPCGNCANDFHNFQLRGSEPPESERPGQFYPKNGVFPEGGLVKNACSKGSNLFEFFVEAHNNVNRHTNPNRIAFTVPMATERHDKQDVCLHNAIWKGSAGKGLCRSKQDTGCITYSFP